MKKIAIIYGTRPEFLKVLPIIFEAKKRNLNFITINTGQHSNLLNELENLFDFKPDYNLKVQDVNSDNSELLSKIFCAFSSESLLISVPNISQPYELLAING